MSDTQPLLVIDTPSYNDGSDNKRRSLFGKFFAWLQSCGSSEVNNEYENLDSDSHIENDSPIGFFELFRFASSVDYFMLFIGACTILMQCACFILYFLLFSRLTGTFATKSFVSYCHQNHQKNSSVITGTDGCPFGIELNPVNYAHLHKFCNAVAITQTLSTTTVFRADVLSKVYLLLIIGTVQIMCCFVQYFMFDLTAKRQTARIRVRLFEAILQRNISYFDTNATGQLGAKLFNNIDKMSKGIGFQFSLMITLLITTIGCILLALSVNWQLTLIMLCVTPFLFSGTHIFNKHTINETTNELNAYSKAGQIVQEVFSSLRTVLSLNGGKFEQKRYERELDLSRWSSIRKGAVYGAFVGWIFLITYLLYAAGFIFGFLLMNYEEHNTLTISDILVVTVAFAQGISLVGYVGPYLQSYTEARKAAAPVYRLIDEVEGTSVIATETWADSEPVKESIDINGDIQLDNVNFVYPVRQDVSVLRDLTLMARAGETTALVGLSGSGKSTCVSLLLRYYEPLSGHITINGKSLAEYNVKELRKHIGVVSQEPILFNTSIYENIRYGKEDASTAEIEEAARQANAHNFIMRLPNKYETLVGERGSQLSGGEKQRVVLARALVRQPTLLLLDEATSALDNASEKIVQEALDLACKDRTNIVIAHRLSTIQNAHRIYVLDNGSVVEQGTHETLMAQEGGKYREMVKAQQMQKMKAVEHEEIIDPQIQEEDEKQSSERTRLLSMSQSDDADQAFGNCSHIERRSQVLIYSFLFALLGFVSMIVRFFQYSAFAVSGASLTQRIRAKTFACLLRQEVAYFDRPENSSSTICVRLSSDALAVQHILGTRLAVVVETCATISLGFVVGCFFSWQLTLLVYFMILLLFFVIVADIRSRIRLYQLTDFIFGQASSLAVEAIHNIRTVKQLTIEKKMIQQYTKLIDQSFTILRGYIATSALLMSIYLAMGPYIMAALYGCALVLVEHNEIETENVVMIFALTTFSIESIIFVMSIARETSNSISASQNFFDLFDRTSKIDNGSTEGQEIADFRGDIAFEQVTFAYPLRPATRILDKFQLSIKSGQRVALVGASGCGKSTLVQLLERFYDVDQGRLLLDGVDIRQLNIHWVRMRLSLVSQEPVMFDMTIGENIAYGQENIPLEDIIDVATKANIHQFILTLPQGYDTKVGEKGSQLSGGEKQRIAIARALLRRPKVLLLDEATSAMDSQNEQIVQQALEQAQTDDPTRTSLIIAHRLSTIRSCDLICVLDSGRIVESGTHMDLMQQRGAYYRLLVLNSP